MNLKCMLCIPESDVLQEIYVNFDMYNTNYHDTPTSILGGVPTIVGAKPDDDLILLGLNQDVETNINNHTYLDSFNKDDIIKGSVLIIKTNTYGDPIDI